MAQALEEHAEQVAGEVLAVAVHAATPALGDGVDGPRGLALLGRPRLTEEVGYFAARRLRARSARCRSGVHQPHGVKPSVRASSMGSGIVSRPERKRQPSRW